MICSKHQILCIFISVFILSSCANEKKAPFKMPKNAIRLIAGDSAKVWKLAKRTNNNVRMNMGDCFLSYRVTYKTDSTMHDNNGHFSDCGETLTTNWTLYSSDDGYPYIKLKGGQLQKLLHLDVNYKFFKILDLSEAQLVLEFRHKQFSSKESTIVDVLVPDSVSIKNRNFHW
ncbi:lipocalin family protein [uncultured Psychroserpens sp.]|uniref:lipocalin family protein n=1 Tax=uncultured Psychroserpens sp. TaxID=255436 RepID=UPI002608B9A1|nr:lipocalin family protein [uncultured Psychroserpens sp.]